MCEVERGILLSVASHFILFSGVTWPYSAMTMASYEASLRVFLSAQVPKYSLPTDFIFASREPVEVAPEVEDVVTVVGVLDAVVDADAVPGRH